MKKKVDVTHKSYAVLGLGKFGSSVAEELSRTGADVLAVDCNEERVAELADKVTCAVKADVCDTGTMATLGLSNMDGVVVAITGSIHASVLGTILAKEAGVPYVMAKSQDEVHSKILEKVGADKVLIPEKESGISAAHAIMSGTFMAFISAMWSTRVLRYLTITSGSIPVRTRSQRRLVSPTNSSLRSSMIALKRSLSLAARSSLNFWSRTAAGNARSWILRSYAVALAVSPLTAYASASMRMMSA